MIEEVRLYPKRTRKPTSAYRKKRLARDRDMWEEFGLKKPAKPRYVGLQGVLWFLTSTLVRRQDFALYGGMCVDGCGEKVSNWKDAHAGHFQTASKPTTRFIRENLGLQLPGCNKAQQEGDSSKTIGFAKEIDRRHGAGTADKIIALSLKKEKNMKDDELREKIKEVQAQLCLLTP